ncbi:MAG: hypothetical protein BWK72_11185 [Rhodoferax ferrireducens]|uniref:Uncharacterized protein n=1 Tax=Rhodoferax ferrireducens TaxID=192843 RepID=A0A1W9KTZ1_9BURK|nr:MAG: hypothetical protein BWK72_11185 [Rhodoferax ferrireducens]
MRFWGAITRGVGVVVRAGPLTRALCPKARSPNPITAPETLLAKQAGGEGEGNDKSKCKGEGLAMFITQ